MVTARLFHCLLIRPYSSEVDDASGQEGRSLPNSWCKNGAIIQIGEVRPLVNETVGWSKALPQFRAQSSYGFSVLARALSGHMQESVIRWRNSKAQASQATKPKNLDKVFMGMKRDSMFSAESTSGNSCTCHNVFMQSAMLRASSRQNRITWRP